MVYIMKKLIWVFLILTGLMLFSACNLPSSEAPPLTATVPPADPMTDEPVSIFGRGTFGIALPSGWDVSGPETINTDPSRPYEIYLLGENPTTDDGPGSSRVIIANAAEWTPEELALTQCSTCPQNPFESITLGGKPGVRTQIGGGGVPFMLTWYFVENQGNLIAFTIHDPQTLEPLDAVIQSIHFE